MTTSKTRILITALLLALVASIVPMGAAPMASSGDVLFNGGFENGFVANAGCGGMVGAGWGCFNNGGTAAYGYYDDMWPRTVYAGSHSQLIEINTKQMGGDGNRTAGIYQTVHVMPGTAVRAVAEGHDPGRRAEHATIRGATGCTWASTIAVAPTGRPSAIGVSCRGTPTTVARIRVASAATARR